MKTIKVFETIDELLHGFQVNRTEDDEFPFIPFSLSIRVNNDGWMEFVGKEAERFQISKQIDYYDLVDRVLEIQGIRFEVEVKEAQENEQK